MKRFFIILSVCFLVANNQKVLAQDQLILNSGDTVECSIVKITRKYVHFSKDFDGISTKGKILKSNVKGWFYYLVPKEDSISHSSLVQQESKLKDNLVSEKNNLVRIRASGNGGISYLLGKTNTAEQSLQMQGVSETDSKNYYDKLKLGYHTKALAYYRFADNFWVGGIYSGFYTTSSINTPIEMDEINMYYGKLGERFFVNFAGPSVFLGEQYGKNQQWGLNLSFSLGPAFYRNELEILNEQILIQGASLATNVTLGMEFFLNPRCSLSVESSLFTSQVKRVKVNTVRSFEEIDLDEENYENLSRIDLSIGFVFYW